MKDFTYKNCYLVGVKGVGMTALAQILLDNQIKVTGCDVAENFVTEKILKNLPIKIYVGFDQPLPEETDCLIYVGAHSGKNNKAVQTALQLGLPVFAQDEILGYFFNLQKGVACCGVGGKSSTSAMIVWILEFLGLKPSFYVGVGEIIGLNRTGRYNPNSEWFVAEADEFVSDPTARERGEAMTPRFMSMRPTITLAKELVWDHPDVYPTESEYIQVFEKFFQQIESNGSLIYKKQRYLPGLNTTASKEVVYYPEETPGQPHYQIIKGMGESTQAKIFIDNQEYFLKMGIPGFFNIDNAMGAILSCQEMGIDVKSSIQALEHFQSTKRRAERVGEKNGVLYFDDYAHHPFEIKNIIDSFKDWFDGRRLVVAFQPHTYSRTKNLFQGFVETLSNADELLLLDIFSSAREKPNPEVSSAKLAKAITSQTSTQVKLFSSLEEMAHFCQKNLNKGDVFLTLGAGDIYEVHEMI